MAKPNVFDQFDEKPAGGNVFDQFDAPEVKPQQNFLGGIVSDAQSKLQQAAAKNVAPYLWGGTDLEKGADCSGALCAVAKQKGVTLPRTAIQQYQKGGKVDGDLQPGDLVFFETKKGDKARFDKSTGKYVTHVGIYMGNGKFQHQSTDAKKGFSEAKLTDKFWSQRFVGARRYAGLSEAPSQSPFALATGEINRRVEKFREDTAPRQRVGGIPVPVNAVTELQRQGAENIPTQAIDPRIQQMLGLQGIQPPPVIPQRKSPTIQPVEQTLVRGKIIEEERKPGYWERLQRDLGLTSLKDFRTSVGNFTNELTGVLEKYGVGQVAGSLAFASPIGSAAALTGTPGSQVYDAGAKIGSSIAANLLNAPLESAAGFAAIVDPEATATEKFWGGLDLALTLIPGAVIAKSGKQAVRALDRLKFAVKGRNADAVKMAIQDAIDSGININQIFKNAPTALDRQLATLVKGTDEAGDIAATFRPKKDQNATIKEVAPGQPIASGPVANTPPNRLTEVPESTQSVATVSKTEPVSTTGKQAEVGNAPKQMVETPTVSVKFSEVATDLKGKDRREALRAQRAAKIQQAAEGGEMQASSIYNPEDLEYFYEVAKTYVEDGIKLVDDIAKRMKADGDDLPKEVRQRLVKEGLIEPPVKGTQKARTATEGGGQGIRQVDIDSFRKDADVPAFVKEGITDAESFSQANKLKGAEAGIAKRLLESKDATLTTPESVALGRRVSDLSKQMRQAKSSGDTNKWDILRAEAENLADALDESGSRQGRDFRARQFIFRDDYEGWTMRRRVQRAASQAGAAIPEEKLATLDAQAEKIANLTDEVEKAKTAETPYTVMAKDRKSRPVSPKDAEKARKAKQVALSNLKKLGFRVVSTDAKTGGFASKQAGAVRIPPGEGDKFTKSLKQLARSYILSGEATDFDTVIKKILEDVPGLTEEDVLFTLSGKYRKAVLEADVAKLEADAAMRQIVRDAEYANRSTLRRAADTAWELATATSRSLQSGLDISAPFIQGMGALLTGNWKEWARSWKPMIQALGKEGGEEYAAKMIAEIKRHPMYARARKAGLDLTEMGAGFTRQEENFAGNLIEIVAKSELTKSPLSVVGPWARGILKSEAAFNAFNNSMRWQMFLKYAEVAPNDPAFLKDAASMVNIITGRGSGSIAKNIAGSKPFGVLMYAPRYLWSNIQWGLGVPLFSATGKGRSLAVKQYLKMAGLMAGTIGFAKMMQEKGADISVDTDPRSTGFGRISIPSQKISFNPFDRALGPAKLLTQMVYGKVSLKGNYTEPSGYAGSYKNAPWQFLTSKSSPLVRFAEGFTTGAVYNFKTDEEEAWSLAKSLSDTTLPISWKNAFDDVTNQELSLLRRAAGLLQLAGAPMVDYKEATKTPPPMELMPPRGPQQKKGSTKSPLDSQMKKSALGPSQLKSSLGN